MEIPEGIELLSDAGMRAYMSERYGPASAHMFVTEKFPNGPPYSDAGMRAYLSEQYGRDAHQMYPDLFPEVWRERQARRKPGKPRGAPRLEKRPEWPNWKEAVLQIDRKRSKGRVIDLQAICGATGCGLDVSKYYRVRKRMREMGSLQ
ncbi:MAG: hypothetical protein MUO23_12550 [Anaerolineales bacterium]|nr:hypothetical protein [Anaerolineales bacterium]